MRSGDLCGPRRLEINAGVTHLLFCLIVVVVVVFVITDGANVGFGRLPQNNLKRGKARTQTGADSTQFQGRHQVFAKDARAWYVVPLCLCCMGW